MKRCVSAILIVLLALQSFHALTIYSYYYANKGYITTVLCINQDKPQLKCEGKCYLNKQLQKANEQDQKQSSASQKFESPVYITASATASINSPSLVIAVYTAAKPSLYRFQFSSNLFHPPSA